MSSYFVLMINSATDFVRPGAFGNSAGGQAVAGAASMRLPVSASADAANEVLNRSRRFIIQSLISIQISFFRGVQGSRHGMTINCGNIFRSDFLSHIGRQLIEQQNHFLPPAVFALRLRIM